MAISALYVDRAVADMAEVGNFQRCLGLEPIVVDGADPVYRQVSGATDPISRGKEVLFLTQNRGAFVRDCPGTRNYACCGYRILHVGTYCTMDCAYCILQSYFHPPVLQYFINHPAMFAELDQTFAEPRISRIGTGEFTDSLIWQYWTDLCQKLILVFSRQDRAVLELKTKTVAIEGLKNLHHNSRTILSWSVNTPRVIAAQERKTASLDARIDAARRCQEWGYPVAFHFDPMVIYDGCETEYHQVATRMLEKLDVDRIAWISLGTFRFMPALKDTIAARFRDSTIAYGEFITGLDGKMRYFKPLRISLYRVVAEAIAKIAPRVPVYFCMEDEEVWQKSLGYFPEETEAGIGRMLDRSAVDLCGLDRTLLK